MLSADDLKGALHEAVKGAERCGRFCFSDAVHDDGKYRIHHNGTGNRDTDVQVVYAPAALNLGKEPLTEKLRAWITDLHSGNKIDLNATMATGGPVSVAQFYLVGERGCAIWTTCFHHNHLHLHTEGSCTVSP